MRYTKQELQSFHMQALQERQEYEAYWKDLSKYLLPGRGIYQLFAKPQKRELVHRKVINNTGNDALQVFTSGFHGGLTASSRPWVKFKWKDPKLDSISALKMWLDKVSKRFHNSLLRSNFYETMPVYYNELAGFGTGALYMGELWDYPSPFHFEVLTAGEYCFTLDSLGFPSMFFRQIFKPAKDVVKEFKNVDETTKRLAETNPNDFVTVIQVITAGKTWGKQYTSYYYQPTNNPQTNGEFLKVNGFYEFPVFLSQWEPVGNDPYGTGLGIRALPDLKSLQEMEMAYRMGVHRVVKPPLQAPPRLKGHVKTLPDYVIWNANPNEKVEEFLKTQLDLNAVGNSIERIETKLRRLFFNDLFITASRDPNASPLKAAEVYEKKEERLIRIGPSTERLLSRTLQPLVLRGLQILKRHDMLPVVPPEYINMVGDLELEFVSPLAQSQKLVAMQSINNFLGFAAGIAQFDPAAKDKVNTDRLMDEGADIFGVPMSIMSTKDELTKVRQDRMQMAQKQQQKEDALLQAELKSKMRESDAAVTRDYSEAGVNTAEALGNVTEQQRAAI